MPAVSFRIRRGPHYKASRILALAKTKPDAAIEPPLRDKRARGALIFAQRYVNLSNTILMRYSDWESNYLPKTLRPTRPRRSDSAQALTHESKTISPECNGQDTTRTERVRSTPIEDFSTFADQPGI